MACWSNPPVLKTFNFNCEDTGGVITIINGSCTGTSPFMGRICTLDADPNPCTTVCPEYYLESLRRDCDGEVSCSQEMTWVYLYPDCVTPRSSADYQVIYYTCNTAIITHARQETKTGRSYFVMIHICFA